MRVAEASADLRGSLCPDEGFGILVPDPCVEEDGSLEGRDAGEGSSTNGLLSDSSKPSLDQVEPEGACGCQMKMKLWVLGQPGPDGRVLASAVVVADQMDLLAPVFPVEDFQEGQELMVRVPAEASCGDSAGGHLKSGKQACGAMPNVVVRHSSRKGRSDRQDWPGPIQRLNLRLVIDAEHQSLFRRIQIEPHDVGHLAVKVRVRAELEGFHPMRLQSMLLPDPVHRHVADLQLPRQA